MFITDTIMDEPQENPKKTAEQVERWMGKARPAWRKPYEYLLAKYPGIRYYDALLAVWLSRSRDDQGELTSQEKFADFIGVARPTTYTWIKRRPEILAWKKELIELRFDDSVIGQVDAVVTRKATSRRTTVQWVRLFYERAGLLKTSFNLHHTGGDGNPIQFIEVAAAGGERESEPTD